MRAYCYAWTWGTCISAITCSDVAAIKEARSGTIWPDTQYQSAPGQIASVLTHSSGAARAQVSAALVVSVTHMLVSCSQVNSALLLKMAEEPSASATFVASLEPPIRARVAELEKLQSKYDDHETEYNKELAALEEKYFKLYGKPVSDCMSRS